MTVEKALRLTAGFFVLLSVVLAVWHSQWWLAFTAFVGVNLFQSGLTDWCPAVWLYQKLGLKRCTEPMQSEPSKETGAVHRHTYHTSDTM